MNWLICQIVIIIQDGKFTIQYFLCILRIFVRSRFPVTHTFRFTSQRQWCPTARNSRNILSIRFLNTKKERILSSSRVSASRSSAGKRRYDAKQKGFGGQTKPVFRKKAKTTKKVTLKFECTQSKAKKLMVIKRCKTFILGQTKEINPYYWSINLS